MKEETRPRPPAPEQESLCSSARRLLNLRAGRFPEALEMGKQEPGGSHEHQCARTGSLRIAWQAQPSSAGACAPPRAPGVPLGRRRSSASPSIQLGAREGHKQGTGPREASQPHRWSQGPAPSSHGASQPWERGPHTPGVRVGGTTRSYRVCQQHRRVFHTFY